MTIKIYISGTYSDQTRLREHSHKLFAMGHQVTSTWLNEVKQPAHLTHDEWFAKLALKDLCEVASSDCIILDLDGVSTSGGRYVEWGFAVGRFSMLKYIVGSNHYGVFNYMADQSFLNWDDLLKQFGETYGQGTAP